MRGAVYVYVCVCRVSDGDVSSVSIAKEDDQQEAKTINEKLLLLK